MAASRPLPTMYIHAISILERRFARVQNGMVSTRGTNICKIVTISHISIPIYPQHTIRQMEKKNCLFLISPYPHSRGPYIYHSQVSVTPVMKQCLCVLHFPVDLLQESLWIMTQVVMEVTVYFLEYSLGT